MTPCILVNSYRRFGGVREGFWFHLHGFIKSNKSEPLGKSEYLLNFLNPEEGGNKLLRNVNNCITTYTASYPRRLLSSMNIPLYSVYSDSRHNTEWNSGRDEETAAWSVLNADEIYSINISRCVGYTIREYLVLRRQRQTPHVSG